MPSVAWRRWTVELATARDAAAEKKQRWMGQLCFNIFCPVLSRILLVEDFFCLSIGGYGSIKSGLSGYL